MKQLVINSAQTVSKFVPVQSCYESDQIIPPGTPCIYRVSQEECARLRESVLMLKYTDITQNIYIQS